MTTFSNIGLAEPSTITKSVASVVIARGSTNEHQEILVLGDPTSSLGVARVLAAAPASTEFGLAVRIVSGPSSAADLPVQMSGNSTVLQGTSPWVIAGNSTVVQGTSPWVIAGNSTVIQGTSPWVIGGNSSVRANLSSTAADNPVSISGNSTVIQGTNPWVIGGNSSVRANLSSTAADNPVLVSGNSTVFQGGSPWAVSPSSTGWASSAGFHFDTSGSLLTAGGAGGSSQVTVSQVLDSSGGGVVIGDSVNNALRVNVVAGAAGGSTIVTISTGSITVASIAAAAGRINIGSTAADNLVLISGNSTVLQGTSPWVVGGNSTSRLNIGSTAADNVVTIGAATVRVNIGSTAADNAVVVSGNSTVLQGTSPWVVGGNSTSRLNIGSTAADNAVLVSGNSTVFQGGAPWIVDLGTALQSTGSPSSGSSGLIVRQALHINTSFASTSALASTVLSVVSSVASLRAYVTAYTITSTNQTPAHWGFFSSNATLLWPMILAGISSAVTGANLAVSNPGYLFRTAAGEALNFKTAGSTVAGVQLGVAYFQAP